MYGKSGTQYTPRNSQFSLLILDLLGHWTGSPLFYSQVVSAATISFLDGVSIKLHQSMGISALHKFEGCFVSSAVLHMKIKLNECC